MSLRLDSPIIVGYESFNGMFPSKEAENAVAFFDTVEAADEWKAKWSYRRWEHSTLGDFLSDVTRGLRDTAMRARRA